MELIIKNMVCRHCIEAVRRTLESAGLTAVEVELGRAEVEGEPGTDVMSDLAVRLRAEGFDLISDPEERIVELTKLTVLHHVREEREKRHNLSQCIERRLGMSYPAVSRIFSAREGRTLEKYHIAQKIERVKELMQYGEMTLSEIAYETDYSSVAHLSRQFKAVTGMTPTEYLKGPHSRSPLAEV